MKLECPMTPSTKVLYRNLGALPGQITQSRSRRNHPIGTTRSPLDHQEAYLLILHSTRQAKNKEEKRSRRNHSITPSWHPLDRTRSQGRWTIQSRLHYISLDRKAEPLKPSLINDTLDHKETHFSPLDANDKFGRRIMTWRFAIYLVSLFVSFFRLYKLPLRVFPRASASIRNYLFYFAFTFSQLS